MKLLIIGGEKVSNIEHALSSRYQSGVVRIDTLKYLDELEDYLVSGKSFERVIIIDNTFAKDTLTVTQSTLRTLMIELADTLASITERFDIIFVLTKPEFGLAIEEEMMAYGDSLKIVQVQGGYTVKLFEELCMKDINDIRSHYGLVKVTNLVESPTIQGNDNMEISEGFVDGNIPNPPSDLYAELDDIAPTDTGLEYEQDEAYFGSYVPSFGDQEVEESFPPEDFPAEEPRKINLRKEPQAESTGLNPFGGDLYTQDGADDFTMEPDPPTPEPPAEPIPQAPPAPQIQLKKTENNQDSKGFLFGLGKKKKEKKLPPKPTPQQPIPQPMPMPMPQPIPMPMPQAPPQPNGIFDQSMYQQDQMGAGGTPRLSSAQMSQLQHSLGKLSDRRATYIFTGTPNSGASTMSFGVAELLSQQGYNVLLVDCDTHNRSMAYISKDLFTMAHHTDETSCNLITAISSPLKTTSVTHIASQGFHVLTLGLDQDTRPLNEIIDPIKFQRFTGVVREHYHFIIYDMPYDILMTLGTEVAFISDGIIMTTEANTNGLIKLMNYLANIDNPEVRALMFTKIRVLLTKHMQGTSYFGKNTQRQQDIFAHLDRMVETITGMEAEYRFRDLNVIDCVGYHPKFVNQWCTKNTPCQDKQLEAILINVLNGIVTL